MSEPTVVEPKESTTSGKSRPARPPLSPPPPPRPEPALTKAKLPSVVTAVPKESLVEILPFLQSHEQAQRRSVLQDRFDEYFASDNDNKLSKIEQECTIPKEVAEISDLLFGEPTLYSLLSEWYDEKLVEHEGNTQHDAYLRRIIHPKIEELEKGGESTAGELDGDDISISMSNEYRELDYPNIKDFSKAARFPMTDNNVNRMLTEPVRGRKRKQGAAPWMFPMRHRRRVVNQPEQPTLIAPAPFSHRQAETSNNNHDNYLPSSLQPQPQTPSSLHSETTSTLPSTPTTMNTRPNQTSTSGEVNLPQPQQRPLQQQHTQSQISSNTLPSAVPTTTVAGTPSSGSSTSALSTPAARHLELGSLENIPLTNDPTDQDGWTSLAEKIIKEYETRRAAELAAAKVVEEEAIPITSLEKQFQEFSLQLEDCGLASLAEENRFRVQSKKRRPLINYQSLPRDVKLEEGYVPDLIQDPDLVLTVAFFQKNKPTTKAHEIQVLASQPLSALRDEFYCLADFRNYGVTEEEEAGEGEEINVVVRDTADKKTSNSFFFIENTFFVDTPLLRARSDEYERIVKSKEERLKAVEQQIRSKKKSSEKTLPFQRESASGIVEDVTKRRRSTSVEKNGDKPLISLKELEAQRDSIVQEHIVDFEDFELEDEAPYETDSVDYSESILDWIHSRQSQGDSDFQQHSYSREQMCRIRFQDLGLRINHPYLFVHQGKCEHLVVFQQLHVFNPEFDDTERRNYPRTLYRQRVLRHLCRMCMVYPAEYVTLDDRLSGESPCYFCEQCYTPFHYDAENQILRDDFQVFAYSRDCGMPDPTRGSVERDEEGAEGERHWESGRKGSTDMGGISLAKRKPQTDAGQQRGNPAGSKEKGKGKATAEDDETEGEGPEQGYHEQDTSEDEEDEESD